MADDRTVEIPFRVVGNKQLLTCYDIKLLGLEDFVERFKHCFDFYSPVIEGIHGAYFYPDGVPSNVL